MSENLAEKLSAIPFRVVIFKILPFFEFKLKESEELGLFGYFSKDRTRRIFTIFSSIRAAKLEQLDVPIDISKIQSLIIYLPYSFARTENVSSFFRKLINTSSKFTSLKTMTLGSPLGLERIISMNPNFPKLERFRIERETTNINLPVIPVDRNTEASGLFWKRLKHYWNQWNVMSVFPSPVYFEDQSSILKSLTICLPGGHNLPVNIRLPELEHLSLSSNLNLFPKLKVFCQKLKSFKFKFNIQDDFRNGMTLLKNVLIENPKVDDIEIEIYGDPEAPDADLAEEVRSQLDFFFKRENLRSLVLSTKTTILFDWETNFPSFRNSIEEIKIELFTPDIQENTTKTIDIIRMMRLSDFEYPKLRKLSYSIYSNYDNENPNIVKSSLLLRDTRLSFCQTLTSMTLQSVTGFTGEFFRVNEFKNLREFTFDLDDYSERLDMKSWNPFPELRKLVIYCCGSTEGRVFEEENKFPKLETLLISSMKGMGEKNFFFENWSATNTKNLKRLEIFSCEDFTGSIFQDEELFPSLEVLKFDSTYGTMSETPLAVGWKGMLNLQKFCIGKHRNISELFEVGGEWMDNLRVLKIFVQDTEFVLDYHKWKVFKKLKVLRLFKTLKKPDENVKCFPLLRRVQVIDD